MAKDEITKSREVRHQKHGGQCKRSGNVSHVQQYFDFDSECKLPPVSTLDVCKSPCCEFAVRFAALLFYDPDCTFNNNAVSNLARDYFGKAAGHARDGYDAAEAGFNLYLKERGLNFNDVPKTLTMLLEE